MGLGAGRRRRRNSTVPAVRSTLFAPPTSQKSTARGLHRLRHLIIARPIGTSCVTTGVPRRMRRRRRPQLWMTTPAPMLHGWEHAHRGPCPDAGGEETRIFPDPSFRQCVLPGRTDNEIKNYWNTRTKRRERAGLPLYPPEVEHEVALIRAGGPNTILGDDAGAAHELPFLFDAADPLASLPLPPPASDSPALLYHFGKAAQEPLPLPYISNLQIDPVKYLQPLAPLLPPMAHRELPSVQSAAIATGAALETMFLRELGHQQVPDANLVNFGAMPGLVSYENAVSSHCVQEEVQNLGDKRGRLSGDEKPAKRLLASSVADDKEMPNLLRDDVTGEAPGHDAVVADQTIFLTAGSIDDDELQHLMMPSAPLICDEDGWNQ
ncbi:hypothetical protein PAHAL_1G046800 [Panicum hallii]|uniref:HTH myb-type domain-containing protein n=1 Tax=Panicum hallii TaxID=206008 RepID=A0A2S3GLK7_9POAL|nr:uncharacterized protein LOC112901560 isoform X1 [Panicum hallii]PAN04170.1 hypothetical protein PAHAL_1G046800 [Panicum hallii]